MDTRILILLLVSAFWMNFVFSQNVGSRVSLGVVGVYENNAISLNWSGEVNNEAKIYRRESKRFGWLLLEDSAHSPYLDNSILLNEKYEYKVVMNSSVTSELCYGYASVSTMKKLEFPRSSVLVLVDSLLFGGLQAELHQLQNDFLCDGLNPSIIPLPSRYTVPEVKALIIDEYSKSDLHYVYIIGKVAVPYSGHIAPDGHQDHYGAWPADGYYGDMNDNKWQEYPFFSTPNARDDRNSNVFGDGKFDLSVFPSTLEMVVSRIDFSNLPVYEKSELDLTREYLSRASDYKNGKLIYEKKGLIDDNLGNLSEGFGLNMYMNFSGLLGRENIIEGDFIPELNKKNYLCALGTSYANDTDAFDLGSSKNIADTATNAMLKMLMGSYFGDWDTKNNFLRANLASGNTLNAIWMGRPNIFLNDLSVNKTIGDCFLKSCNNGIGNTLYEPAGSYRNSVSLALFGDPTTRLSMGRTIQNALAYQTDSAVFITWDLDYLIDYYIIFKWNEGLGEYEFLAETNSTEFNDLKARPGNLKYIVNGVYKDEFGTASFLNHTMGSMVDITFDYRVSSYKGVVNLKLSLESEYQELKKIEVKLLNENPGIYKLELQRKEENGDWEILDVRTILVSNENERLKTEYFYNVVRPRVKTYFRSICIHLDSVFYSNDTMITHTHPIKIHPNPCSGNTLWINSDSAVTSQDIALINSEGRPQIVDYNPESQSLDLSMLRKGLYLLRIRDEVFKFALTR